jgi:hypothetical protein
MDSIMNQAAVDQIVTNSQAWIASLNRVGDVWLDGFTTTLRWVEQSAAPIVKACADDYDAEYPIMNRAAVTAIWADCEYGYERNQGADADWLLGASAGIQRFEMYAGDIVADCT